jgi:hypothetical protein
VSSKNAFGKFAEALTHMFINDPTVFAISSFLAKKCPKALNLQGFPGTYKPAEIILYSHSLRKSRQAQKACGRAA